VISETWGFIGETCFEVSASTIFASTFTSFGQHLISDIFVMWAS
jgi:hypothetical protein